MRCSLVSGVQTVCSSDLCHKGVYVKSGQHQRLEQPGLADGILRAGSRQITCGRLNRGVYIVARRQSAECIYGDGSARFSRYSSTSHAQFGVMLLDPYQFAPQLVVKGNAPHAEDQFMQALAMLGVDAQTGIDILIDEDVIEDSDVRQAADRKSTRLNSSH